MYKFKNKPFNEINDDNLFAVGEYDDELNFKIIEKSLLHHLVLNEVTNLDVNVDNIKKVINKIEHRTNISDVNVIINQTDLIV